MGRREKSWGSGLSNFLFAIMLIAVVTGTPGCVLVDWLGFGSDDGGDTYTPVEDGSLPLCQEGKRDDGTLCREPADGGVPEDATCPDAEPEVSGDAETPDPDSGTEPETCPPKDLEAMTECVRMQCAYLDWFVDPEWGCITLCPNGMIHALTPDTIRGGACDESGLPI